MFHKFCACMIFVGCVSAAFAFDKVPQVVTSEVFYDYGEEEQKYVPDQEQAPEYGVSEYENVVMEPDFQTGDVPVWPLAGSDADVAIACSGSGCPNNGAKVSYTSNSDIVIENNIVGNGTGWTGGPDISNEIRVPAGFDYECANNSEMPLLRREMMEDDGGSVLAMSRSSRKNCNKSADSYAVFAKRAGFVAEPSCNKTIESETEVPVNESVDEETSGSVQTQDQVRSWVVASGQTLRQVLQSWCDKEGWDLVWTTAREYPIEASAVFKGRFVDVASALVRNFERATPIPYAKFYKGNRVIVVSTTEE